MNVKPGNIYLFCFAWKSYPGNLADWEKKLYTLINILHNMFIQINCPVWKTFRLLTNIEFDIHWKYEKGGCHQHTALASSFLESPSSTPTLNTPKYTFARESSLRPFPFFFTLRYEEQVLLTALSTLLVQMSFSNRREWNVRLSTLTLLDQNKFCHYYSSCFRRSGQIVFFLKVKRTWKVIVFLIW